MAEPNKLETSPSTELPNEGTPKPAKKQRASSTKHRPDMPTGLFGNTGKAKGKVLNK